MSKQHIETLILQSLTALKAAGSIAVDFPAIQIDPTKDKQHGDFACNIAMLLAKPTGKKPRELAEMIVKSLPASDKIAKVEIAGPGFINFFLSANALQSVIAEILSAKENYGKSTLGQGKRVLVEFVSSNPTGPLHVGHGRHAAYGAAISNLLETIGYQVHREYYVNDAGRQMDIIAVSVWLRYLSLHEQMFEFPANGYQGEYVIAIARVLQKEKGDTLSRPIAALFDNLPLDEPQGGDKEIYIDALISRAKQLLGEALFQEVLQFTLENIIAEIKDDLAEFGVTFQEWFSERKFVESGQVERDIQTLKDKGLTYENEGALWFRSTDFGDEKDRVLERANGQRTYFANDLSYHFNKFKRGFDFSILILGSDHHGYVSRVKAALTALGLSSDKLTYLLMQFVSLYRGDTQIKMSTRSGSFVTLRELREEVGNDAARYFYVMRKCEQPVDFDLELAKKQTNDNPVFYIQYAHARICSVFRQLAEKNLSYAVSTKLDLLTEPHEVQLITTLALYPDIIMNAAKQYEPHILTNYLRDLATDFHTYYNSHQFIADDETHRNARLTLISATKQVLVNGLKLLGVSQPESM